jgi:hypothetical protein
VVPQQYLVRQILAVAAVVAQVLTHLTSRLAQVEADLLF